MSSLSINLSVYFKEEIKLKKKVKIIRKDDYTGLIEFV